MTAEASAAPASELGLPPSTPVPSRTPTLLTRPINVLVGLQAAWLWWAYAQGWFLQADLSNLVDGLGHNLSWHYLTSPVGGHFGPVGRLVYWILDQLSPLDYGLTVAARVVCQAVVTVLLYKLLMRLVEREFLCLAIVAVYAFNPFLLAGTAMFTPGIALGLGEIFFLLALHAHVRRETTGHLRAAMAAGGWLAVATLCSEQWALAALAFPVLSAVHFVAGPVRARLVYLIRSWRTWVLLTAPVFVVGLGSVVFAEASGASAPSLTASYRILRNSWLYSLGPSFAGGPLHWYADASTFIPTSAPTDLMVVLGQIAAGVVVLAGVQRNGWASLAGWLLPVSVWVITMLLVGYRGFAQLQDLVAITPRYVCAFVPLFAIGAALALAPGGVAQEGTPRSVEGPTGQHAIPVAARISGRWQPHRVAAVVLVAVVVAASVVSGVRFARIFGKLRAESYVDTLAFTARAAGRNVNVYDTPVPGWLISPVEPHHRVTDLLRLLGLPAKVNDPSSPPLIANGSGQLVRSVFVPASAVPAAPPCGTALHGAGTFTFALNRPVQRAEWYLHLTLYQQTASTVTVELVDAAGHVATPVGGGTRHLPQLASFSLRLPAFAPTKIRFTVKDPSTALCLTSIQVGAPFPITAS